MARPINLFHPLAPSLFCTFLRRRKAYNSFRLLLGASNASDLRSYFSCTPPPYFLASAFSWLNSPQGYAYWADLDSDWMDVLDLFNIPKKLTY